jgi:hypothetical protein
MKRTIVSPSSRACHVACGDYTKWRVLRADLPRVPLADAPESWVGRGGVCVVYTPHCPLPGGCHHISYWFVTCDEELLQCQRPSCGGCEMSGLRVCGKCGSGRWRRSGRRRRRRRVEEELVTVGLHTTS